MLMTTRRECRRIACSSSTSEASRVASQVAETGIANEMVLGRAHALVELGHFLDESTAVASTTGLSVRFKCLVELHASGAGHARKTDIEIARLSAREVVLLPLVDGSMAHVAVKFTAVGLECAAVHSADLWVDEVPFLHRVSMLTTNLRLLVHGRAAAEAKVFVAIAFSVARQARLVLRDAHVAVGTAKDELLELVRSDASVDSKPCAFPTNQVVRVEADAFTKVDGLIGSNGLVHVIVGYPPW